MVQLSDGSSKPSMKYGMIIVAAVLMALLASCASKEAMQAPSPGITAVYSPPVRLGGKGSLIVFQTPAPTPRAPSAELTADYILGPWSIFFEEKSDRPDSASQLALKQIASMTARFSTIGVSLCSIGSSGTDGASVSDRQRLDAVRALLTKSGIQRVEAGPDDLCKSLAPRSEPFVWVEPIIK